MDRELWQRVKRVAADAWARPAGERSAYTSEACADDEGLRREVLSLLDAMDRVGERFDTPALISPSARLAASEVLDRQAAVVGQRIGPWQIVRELGHGGMGAVYLADRIDGDFEQRVAIKVVRGWIGEDVLQRRLRDERRILAALDHVNIARLIDGGTTDAGLPYIVMEYVEGLTIDAFCQRGPLDVRQRIEVFRQVCTAVHYAHQHLVVHRDIKISNILVTPDGTPKLLDFGIAKILSQSPVAETTRTLFRMLTPEGASPEQLRGEPITTASDVYALGVLLYRLVTNESPYQPAPNTDAELVLAVCDRMPAPPSAVVRAIDADLDRIVLKALRKEPDRRYATVDQFSEDLGRYLDGRPVLAAPDSAAYRARKFVARHRAAVAAAAALVIAVAGGTAATLWQARVAQLERARAERQFNAVRSLASSVLGELYDAVTKLPGSLTARELLIRRATDYLDTLSGEAAGNVGLRRELAHGYNRLGQLQGAGGFPNLGDRDAARRTFVKAAALFESLDAPSMDVESTAGLAESYLRLSNLEVDASQRDARLARVRQLLDDLTARAPSHPRVLILETAVWENIGNEQESKKNYTTAAAAFTRAARAAEALHGMQPDNASASRNLSITYKKLGTENELQHLDDDALRWYEKALVLDRARLAHSPDDSLTRLDLSFSLGALGSLALSRSNFVSAVASYREAIELRRAVLTADPNDEFARSALARGYERLARALGRAGHLDEALQSQVRRIAVSREGLAAHADRDQPWVAHAAALSDSIDAALTLIESARAGESVRAEGAREIQGLLTELGDLRMKWSREGRKGTLPPANDVLERLIGRARRLSGGIPPKAGTP